MIQVPYDAGVRDRSAASRFPVVGATVSAYDPDSDPERSGAAAAAELIGLLGELASSARG